MLTRVPVRAYTQYPKVPCDHVFFHAGHSLATRVVDMVVLATVRSTRALALVVCVWLFDAASKATRFAVNVKAYWYRGAARA